jgi:peptidyl-prolyl cis-trans isomerase C
MTKMLMHTVFTAAALVAANMPQAVAQDDKVLARVNDIEIRESGLDLATADIGPELVNVPPANRKAALVRYLINLELLAAAAGKTKLEGTREFERRLKHYRKRVLKDLYLETKIREAVPESEAKKVYEENAKKFEATEIARARHILVNTEEEARQVISQLKAGGNFAKLAMEKSTAGSKFNGGDLGYFSRRNLEKPFTDAAFALKPGEISEPVKTGTGWHVIVLEDKRSTAMPTFEQVKYEITQSLINKKSNEIIYGLSKDAEINILDPDLAKNMPDLK